MDGLTRINLLSNDFHDFLSLDNGLPCLMPLALLQAKDLWVWKLENLYAYVRVANDSV